MNRAAAEFLAAALRDHPERCFMAEAVLHEDGGARLVIEITAQKSCAARVIELVMDDGLPVKDYA